jgi:hypothetical protein
MKSFNGVLKKKERGDKNMEKRRRVVSLDQETDEYLQIYMDEHKLRFPSDAIAQICKEHKEQQGNEWSLKYISEVVATNMKEVFKNELTKIRVGTNNVDRNTQILIELMNGLYFFEGYEDLISTNVAESQGVTTAKEAVQERITNQRQKKLDWEKSKGGKEHAAK